MSHYFRAAAKCDLTTASASPVPLFNEENVAESHQPAAGPTSADQSSRLSLLDDASSSSNPFERSRAALDGGIHAAIRRDVKREANVLMHLANREAKTNARLSQEAQLTEKLMEEQRRLRGSSSSAGEGAAAASTSQSTTTTVGSQAVLPASAAPKEDEKPRIQDCSDAAIPMFERIKIEEERRLRRANLLGPHVDFGGSIVSLYNTLTFDTLRQDHPDVPPTVLVETNRSCLIPSDPLQLCAASGPSGDTPVAYGKEKIDRMLSATASYRERLRHAHLQLRASQEAAVAAQSAERAVKDVDAATVLRETMEQEHARREFADAQRLLQVAQFHEQSLVGAFAIDLSGARTDPLLPVFPDNVKEALQLAKKPRHPIDVYQAAVRERRAVVE